LVRSKQLKAIQMKKLLAILTVVSIMVACNDSGSPSESSADTTQPSSIDTSTVRPADTTIKK
jgi:hypothetical protein